MKNEFCLQRPPKALHRSVFVTVSLAAHGRLHFELVKQPPVFMGTVLTSPIRMVDKSCFRTLGGNGPKKRLANQVLRHTGSHGVADDLPSAQILVSGKIEPTLSSLNIGDVAQPDLARSLRLELLSQEVLSHRQGVSRVGRRFEPPHLPTAQAEFPTQALDTAHSGIHPVRRQILLQALRSLSFTCSPRCAALISTSIRASSRVRRDGGRLRQP